MFKNKNEKPHKQIGASDFINKIKENIWKKLQIFSVYSISTQFWNTSILGIQEKKLKIWSYQSG